jgi:hydrogenase maturation protease
MDLQTPKLVIGVGNWYRSDDAVGLVVARKLRAMNLPGVQVKEESGEGVTLMEAWWGNEWVIIVDAASSGSRPGTVHTLDADSTTIPSAFFHYSSHAFSVAEAIELARALKLLPPQLIVYGIEGKNFAAGVGLSPEVEHGSDAVIRQVVNQILVFHSRMIAESS